MTNSQPLPQSNTQIEQALTIFLCGGSTLADVAATLASWLRIDFSQAPGQREIQIIAEPPNLELPVSPEHLCHMLEEYASGGISQASLSDWAAFVFMAPFYVNEDEDEDGGVVGDLLQRLSTPAIFDGLDTEVAAQYKIILGCGKT